MSVIEETHDLGRLFWVSLTVAPRTRWISLSHTWEVEEPYRVSPATLVIRYSKDKAIGLGWWTVSAVRSWDAHEEERGEIEEDDIRYAAYVAICGPVSREDYDRAVSVVREDNPALDEESERAVLQDVLF